MNCLATPLLPTISLTSLVWAMWAISMNALLSLLQMRKRPTIHACIHHPLTCNCITIYHYNPLKRKFYQYYMSLGSLIRLNGYVGLIYDIQHHPYFNCERNLQSIHVHYPYSNCERNHYHPSNKITCVDYCVYDMRGAKPVTFLIFSLNLNNFCLLIQIIFTMASPII